MAGDRDSNSKLEVVDSTWDEPVLVIARDDEWHVKFLQDDILVEGCAKVSVVTRSLDTYGPYSQLRVATGGGFRPSPLGSQSRQRLVSSLVRHINRSHIVRHLCQGEGREFESRHPVASCQILRER